MKLLFLCTGNTCRSPMAQGLFQQLLKEKGISGIACDSAGMAAQPGEPAAENAILVCRELGVDLSQHRAKPLSRQMLAETDLFVGMTPSHAAALTAAGVPPHKIKILGVSDPYGGSIATYRASRDQILVALRTLLQELGER